MVNFVRIVRLDIGNRVSLIFESVRNSYNLLVLKNENLLVGRVWENDR